jgi:methionyl-tRNA formyltransferase
MRIAYAGTPEFAVSALEGLIAAGHEIVGVWTQPDRPAGRGMGLAQSAVKKAALQHQLIIHQPPSLKDERALAALRACAADVMVVAAYGLLLPAPVLDMFHYGALNIHASLLPRWRGAAPIHRALLAGDRETGICIMQMDAGLDTGPVLMREAIAIQPRDTTGTLHDKLAALGARMIVAALRGMETGVLQPTPQSAEGVTYAAKIAKAEARIDWRQSADLVVRRIRAFNPFPGASTRWRQIDIKLWQADVVSANGEPGVVLQIGGDAFIVACGVGAVAIEVAQRAGGKRLPAAEFVRGSNLATGDRFE